MSRVKNKLGFIEPQLATLVDHPPRREGWIHEVKHDGYRTLLIIERSEARAYTRNGFDWSDRYPGLVRAAGVSDFDALMSAICWHPHRLIFYAFDLLHLGKDLRDRPLIERRAELKKLLGTDRTSPLQFSDEFTGDASAFFRACAEHRLEGMVSKLASSRYRSGRSKTWLKCKCFTESSFVIIGTDRDRKTNALLALLARAEEQGLTYAGAAFIALPGSERDELLTRLESVRVSGSPIPRLRFANAQWVKPKLTAKVRHLAGDKYLRHATVRAFD